jgi:hypothetical protein
MPNLISVRAEYLSDRALQYYQSLEDKSGTVAGLIELAARGDTLAITIDDALQAMPPIERSIAGRRVTVDDDRILELRRQGLSQAAIGEAVGLSRTQVGNRLRKLKDMKC